MGYFPIVASFEASVGKCMSIWNWIQVWNEPDRSDVANGILDCSEFNTTVMDQCRNNGLIPMVSWAPCDRKVTNLIIQLPLFKTFLTGMKTLI